MQIGSVHKEATKLVIKKKIKGAKVKKVHEIFLDQITLKILKKIN